MRLPTQSRRLLFALFASVLLAVALAPGRAFAQTPAAAPAQPAFSIAGVWETTFGNLTLTQNADGTVTGEYPDSPNPAKVSGKLEGRRLTFSYQERAASGEGVFEFAADGFSFTGTWRERGDTAWAAWNGKRDTPANSFAGLWKTTYGPMRLTIMPTHAPTGDAKTSCTGVYSFNGAIAEIRGTLEADKFTFTYTEPDGVTGEGWFKLAQSGDGSRDEFAGEWKTAAMDKPRAWAGTRTKPKPGVTWLIVLEAHWEHGLTDQEFSYGDMLRTFFQRIPSVSFRHRFIHDKADVERFAGEVRFIAEPVVLYFSSHGSREGISVGDGTVTPEQIAKVLRGASNIRLLHFGACEVMAGDAPARLIKALDSTASFPISGFANTADWGGSAIVDFTYLDLILEHGLDPAHAVNETCRSLSFAHKPESGTPRSKRGVISPSFLTVYPPAPASK